MKKSFKPEFNYSHLYRIRENIHFQYNQLEFNSEKAEDLLYKLDTINKTIQYIEEMDKDREAETYEYELTYSQNLIEHVNEHRVWNRLTTLHYNIIADCDWDDSIPKQTSIDGIKIKLKIEIYDNEEIIKIYMTL